MRLIAIPAMYCARCRDTFCGMPGAANFCGRCKQSAASALARARAQQVRREREQRERAYKREQEFKRGMGEFA